ncbi:MAG TPA: TPM domain-containing protein [Pirellulales bacterium]|nr:TPM domain-containing protein [Pirellulales bacterium]
MSHQCHRLRLPRLPVSPIRFALAALVGVLMAVGPHTITAADGPTEPEPALAERSDEPDVGEPGRMKLKRPGEREFIVDLADLISSPDEQHIREIATKLLDDKATPVIVVTIESMAKYGGDGMRIETFAHLLFDQWTIGHAKLDGQLWNTGILLLVSADDRKARIELGAGWKHEQDALAQQIMEEQIIPRFRQGDFSGGILAGIEALDKMARGLELPKPPTPWWQPVLVVAAIALMIFTVVSLIRRGAGGWAWLLWGAIFSIVGYLLYSFLRSSMNSGGGDFSGGSFGGGYSGGGGATGSW